MKCFGIATAESRMMARGKYLSIEESRKAGQLEQFAKEHPSEGNEKQFDRVFERMAKAEKEKTPDK